ncbi:MAG: PD40 domain-containing protein [Acidobacteria bacterium]|nr:PD40 domain-containing protein [Acidobacteriota bacterium]
MRALLLLLFALPLAAQSSAFLDNLQQLTHGGQNAEAYWSPDGSKLVFQSTRDGLECDQIFVMNADGSDVRMVSTGKGVTTCGYFLADGKSIVYASTHAAGDACPARPDRSQGYVWAVYPTFDIYRTDVNGSAPERLTDAWGYDAEATVNWKTDTVIYTSKSSGDLELWSMRPDGSQKKQLTAATGYDGGAFLSPDNTKIVMRAHHPQGDENRKRYLELLSEDLTAPMKMEIFLGGADGSNWKQLTDFGCASFAPQFTPDGRRIIFSSNRNKCDSREFELFIMDVDGSNLEQVTDFGGFTSFAEFSPDGKRLVFASSLNAKGRYEFNIFVADWLK